MHTTNNGSNYPGSIVLALDPVDFPYPRRYRFFDDDYARENNKWISNSSIRKKLNKAAILGKIVFNYKINNESLVETFGYGLEDFEFYDFFALINLLLGIYKSVSQLKAGENLTNFFMDIEILEPYRTQFTNEVREIFESYRKYQYCNPDFINCVHPWIRMAITSNNRETMAALARDDYKRLEADFVKTANNNRRKINEFLKEKFISSKRVFVCRLDVVFRKNSVDFQKKYSIQTYRRHIDFLFERLAEFNYALDVIYPSALLSGSMMPSNFPVGQIVLISTERVGANKKALKAFASQVSSSGLLDFLPAKPFPKDLVPSVDGMLEFTPSTVEAINWLAEFLTIERRFVAPGQGCTDGSGTAHCFRFIDLKR